MSVVCPTVLASTVEDYREQLEAVASIASRIQIDLGDGVFTTRSIGLDEVWWPEGIQADIHLMYQHPLDALEQLVSLRPNLIILHTESEGNLQEAIEMIKHAGIRAGVALLQDTTVAEAARYLDRSDHALVFSGSLGSFGGRADLSLLRKVGEIRNSYPSIEIGWDGGANSDNILALSRGGVDVLNVGSAIQKANQPANAFRALQRQLSA